MPAHDDPTVSDKAIARGQGREAICQALVRVVAREGFDGVTFRSVAAEAGVTHGLVSYHFGSREQMINETLEWAIRDTIELSRLKSGDDSLESFAAHLASAVEGNPNEAVFQYELLLRARRSHALLDDMRKGYDAYIDAVADSLEAAGIEDDAVSRLVFAALDGLALQQLLYGDKEQTEAAIAALRHLLSLLASEGGDAVKGASRDGPAAPA
ncbi:MAG: TetR/AcrR family transcriptional regulator [Solirubrobacterales bacterium]